MKEKETVHKWFQGSGFLWMEEITWLQLNINIEVDKSKNSKNFHDEFFIVIIKVFIFNKETKLLQGGFIKSTSLIHYIKSNKSEI